LTIDVDAFIQEVHGKQKDGASYGYTGKLGYHPLPATRAGTSPLPAAFTGGGFTGTPVSSTKRGLGSFEIFGQAAAAVGPGRAGHVDPMGGLPVRRLVATGASQSAMRLVAYANGVHPLHQLFDGYLLSVWEGRAPRLDEGPIGTGGVRTAVRSDLGAPMLIVNSEFETTGTAPLDLPAAPVALVRWICARPGERLARTRQPGPTVAVLSPPGRLGAALRRAIHSCSTGSSAVTGPYSFATMMQVSSFSITSAAIPFSFYFAGLHHLDATRAIVTGALEPVFSVLIAALFLGEVVSPIQVAGIAVVLSATVLVQRPEEGREAIAVEPIE